MGMHNSSLRSGAVGFKLGTKLARQVGARSPALQVGAARSLSSTFHVTVISLQCGEDYTRSPHFCASCFAVLISYLFRARTPPLRQACDTLRDRYPSPVR